MKIKKNKILFITLFLLIVISKPNIVKADSYNVSLNGVNYSCKRKDTSAAMGWTKSRYSSAEEARIDCTKHQTNYIDSGKTIHIFDDPTKCTFEETDEYYNCNCRSTVYFECEQTDPSQKPKYSEKHTIEIKFMDESSSLYDKKTCDVTSDSMCYVTAPSYICKNGMIFYGWSSDRTSNCVNSSNNQSTLYFRSSGKVTTYFTYYPCCSNGTVIYTSTPKPSASPTPGSKTDPSATLDPSDSSVEITPSSTPYNTETSQEQNINPQNDNNNQNNDKSNANSLLFIILIVLVVIAIILIIIKVLTTRKKNSNNNNDDNYFNNNSNYYDDDDSNNYYQ